MIKIGLYQGFKTLDSPKFLKSYGASCHGVIYAKLVTKTLRTRLAEFAAWGVPAQVETSLFQMRQDHKLSDAAIKKRVAPLAELRDRAKEIFLGDESPEKVTRVRRYHLAKLVMQKTGLRVTWNEGRGDVYLRRADRPYKHGGSNIDYGPGGMAPQDYKFAPRIRLGVTLADNARPDIALRPCLAAHNDVARWTAIHYGRVALDCVLTIDVGLHGSNTIEHALRILAQSGFERILMRPVSHNYTVLVDDRSTSITKPIETTTRKERKIYATPSKNLALVMPCLLAMRRVAKG